MGSFCICSRRALELFVKEACGVTLRTSRPTRILPISRTRNFGNRSSVRQLQPVASTRQDDSFIPFDADGKSAGPLATPSKGERSEHLGQAGQILDNDALDDEWHAEVEVVAPWPQETSRFKSDEVKNRIASSQDGVAAIPTPSIDNGSLPEHHESLQRPESAQRESAYSTPPDAHQTETAPSGPQRSRAENRMLRKLRRIQAGTFRSTAEIRVREELENSTVKSVLGIMKATKGISVAEEKEESSKAPPASEAVKSSTDAKEVDKPTTLSRPRVARTKTAHQASATKGERRAGLKGSLPKNEAPAPTSRRTASVKETTPKNPVHTSAATTTTSAKETKSTTKPERESWQIQKNALKEKFGEQGWQPRKRLSPDTLDGIRALHVSDPNAYTTPVLAAHFQVTPEAIRRILKSKWRPSTEEVDDRRDRWERRGERKWQAMAEQGTRPPAKWRAKGIKTPQTEQKRAAGRQGGRYVRWEDDKLERAGSSLAQRIL